MAGERNKNTYKVFWNNEIIEIVSKDFGESQRDNFKFAKSIIEKLNVNILDDLEKAEFNNSEDMPPIKIKNVWNESGDIYLNILNMRTPGSSVSNFRVPFESKYIHGENCISIEVAFLNVGNKYIYAISSDLRKRQNTKLVGYSSIWISFDGLNKIVTNKIHQFYTKSSGLVFKVTDNIEEFEDNLIEMITFDINEIDNEIITDDDFALFDNAIKDIQRDRKVYDLKTMVEDFEPSQFARVETMEKLVRNQELKNLFLKENQRCMLCNKTETFLNSKGLQYFEIHHFIPYNVEVQQKFKKNIG
jgi:5-methylcytosine-specific restriction protein A